MSAALNIHDAKTHFSKLVARAEAGEEVIVARGGKPVVKIVALEPPVPPVRKYLGFMTGELRIPDDFDTMFQDEIIAMFEGDD